MNRFDSQVTFDFEMLPASRAIIANVGTGSVVVEIWDGAEWFTDKTYTVKTSEEYFTQNLLMRFTPTGDATVSVDLARGVKL